MILPVWHGVSFEDVRHYSPTLADRIAVATDKGVENVVERGKSSGSRVARLLWPLDGVLFGCAGYPVLGCRLAGQLKSSAASVDLRALSRAAFREHSMDKHAADTTAHEPAQPGRYIVVYDGQCEICQACVSWVKALDGRKKTTPVPISAEAISNLDARFNLEDCLRQLHLLTPDRELHVGWDAVARLAGLFPPTWLVGALGGVFPFRTLGRLLYGFVAANRYSLSKCRGGACTVAKPEAVRKRARLGSFWFCYTLGFLIRLPLVAWASLAGAIRRVGVFLQTYGKKLELLDGKLTILFLHGILPNTVPLRSASCSRGALRRSGNRPRFAEDAALACTPSSARKITNLENCGDPRARGARRQTLPGFPSRQAHQSTFPK